MKCIAIDDEPLALNVIKDFCSKIDFVDLVATASSAMAAGKLIMEHEPDLLFLDIQMPNITGLEFAKNLKNPPIIIFTTAYSEHALEGFEVDALDYLVKPIPFHRFFKAVSKANEIYQLRHQTPAKNDDDFAKSLQGNDYLLIKVEYSTVKISLNDILFIEGVKDYVKIVLKEGSYLTKSTMKHLMEKLPSLHFMRIHKSYIIALDNIEKIENYRLVYGKKRIPVGDQYKEHFNEVINKKRL